MSCFRRNKRPPSLTQAAATSTKRRTTQAWGLERSAITVCCSCGHDEGSWDAYKKLQSKRSRDFVDGPIGGREESARCFKFNPVAAGSHPLFFKEHRIVRKNSNR